MHNALARLFLTAAIVTSALTSGAGAAATATAVSDATTVRPGLWEVTATSDLLRLVPAIPPDQMQNLMNLARQHGIDMPKIQNGAAVSRACISPAMAARQTLPILYQHQAGCSTRNAQRDGNQFRVEFACSSERVKGNGKAQGTFSDAENFSGQSSFDGVVQGTPVNERADVNGRWIAANCGAVKPVE